MSKGQQDTGQQPILPECLALLEKDPQTGSVNPKSRSEAKSILQAEAEGLVLNPRRPNLDGGEPNLDFVIDGGYADIKTPVSPSFRAIDRQAQDIARSVQVYDANVWVIIDLKNLSPVDKGLFITELQMAGTNMTNVRFINQ